MERGITPGGRQRRARDGGRRRGRSGEETRDAVRHARNAMRVCIVLTRRDEDV